MTTTTDTTTMINDLRYAIRQLRGAPGFALVAVVSLALGIGANSAIFSIANTLLLRPVVAEGADRLVRVYRNRHSPLEYRTVARLRDAVPAFDAIVGERLLGAGRTDGDAPRKVSIAITVGDYFGALGLRPALGRLYAAADSGADAAATVVLSHRYWRQAFGADSAAVGRTVRVNGRPFVVVGVAPEGFTSSMLLWSPDMFFPTAAAEPLLGVRPAEWGGSIYVTARLRPGATRGQADAQLGAAAARIMAADMAADPDRYRDAEQRLRFRTGVARGVHEELRGATTAASAFLLAIVGLVLLIACANVANLLLARATSRSREIGVRLALGAARWRVVRQLLAESLVLAVAGGTLGVLAAAWLTPQLGLFVASRVPEPVAIDFAPDGRVLAYAAALCVATALAFGLAPALRASRPEVIPSLKEGSPGAGRRRSRLRSSLVVAQVALCTVVLAGATLFAHSLVNARVIDPGFPTAGLVDAAVDVESRQLAPEARAAFFARLLERARALPGVRGAALAELVPLAGSNMEVRSFVEGAPNPERQDGSRLLYFNVVGDGYFATMGIPVLRGREFGAQDRDGAPGAVVVNETLAARLWPGQDPIGKRIATESATGPWMTVVGVARDAKYNSLGEETPPFMYLAQAQQPRRQLVLHARAAPGAEGPVAASIRRLVAELDPLVPPPTPAPIADDMGIALLPAQLGAGLLGAFGALALLLASVGIYGVTSYAVAQRTREIGIRGALGAARRDLVSLVLGQTGRLVVGGLALGMLLAFGLSKLLQSQLYGVAAGDPVTFVVTPLVLLGVAVLAVLVPARRATRVDPVVALRAE